MRAAQFDPHPTIYFVRSQHQGLIKIGFSSSIIARMRSLELDNAAPLELIGAYDGNRGEEQSLFTRFASLRVHGEWFRADDSLLAYIEERAEKPIPYLYRLLGNKAHLFIKNLAGDPPPFKAGRNAMRASA